MNSKKVHEHGLIFCSSSVYNRMDCSGIVKKLKCIPCALAFLKNNFNFGNIKI